MGTTPAFVAVSTLGSSTSTITLTIPACNDGDHIVICCGSRGGSPAVSGYTTYAVAGGSGGYFARASIFHKIATAADSGASVSVTGLGGATGYAWALVYRPARRNRPVPTSGDADSGVTEVSTLSITGPTSIEGNTVNVAVFVSTDDTAPEDQTVTNSYGTSRASNADSSDALGVRVVEDTSAIATTRTATPATTGLMAAVVVCLAGTGGMVQVI